MLDFSNLGRRSRLWLFQELWGAIVFRSLQLFYLSFEEGKVCWKQDQYPLYGDKKNTNHKQVTRIMEGEQGNWFDNRVISISLSFLLVFFSTLSYRVFALPLRLKIRGRMRQKEDEFIIGIMCLKYPREHTNSVLPKTIEWMWVQLRDYLGGLSA